MLIIPDRHRKTLICCDLISRKFKSVVKFGNFSEKGRGCVIAESGSILMQYITFEKKPKHFNVLQDIISQCLAAMCML